MQILYNGGYLYSKTLMPCHRIYHLAQNKSLIDRYTKVDILNKSFESCKKKTLPIHNINVVT